MISFSTRKVIALAFTFTFCYLTLVGKLKTSDFIPVFSMVIGYYFGKATALDVPGASNKDLDKKIKISYDEEKNNIQEKIDKETLL